MKKVFTLFLVVVGVVGGLSGCSQDEAHGEDVTAQIQAMKPADRFDLIKKDPVLSLEQKDIAIDNIQDATDQQKADWKAELRNAPAPGSPEPNRGG